MRRIKRRQLYIDPAVQTAFILRAVFYWVTCLVTVVMMLVFTSMLAEPARLFYPNADSLWFRFVPTALTALLMLPVIVFDMLRLSNRLVGPVFRLRRGLRQLAEGQPVQPIHFRDGDFWRDFADEFNAVAAQLQAAQKTAARKSEDAELLEAGA